jgi:cation diffusion facilitator CzcD-associated flavoprotein CzcO
MAVRNGAVVPECDVVIVGAGFGGCYLLRNLRKHGFSVRVFEEGEDLGGVWWRNRYPGARVDTNVPFYEYSDPELWKDWVWEEAYPSQKELQKYFKFVDKRWDLSKDITFGAKVVDASFNGDRNEWTVSTNKGHTTTARIFLLATGFAAKIHVPPVMGLEKFQGLTCHTADWPHATVDLHDRRVGVVGTGASGVQVIQELAGEVKTLIVFQRTPNYALPMRQKALTPEQLIADRQGYPELFRKMKLSHAGFDYSPVARRGMQDTPEEQHVLFEALWRKGGFASSQGNYSDFMTSIEVNHNFYRFWRDKVRERLIKEDPELIENLAPWDPPYPFGTKRPSLEQAYYEVYNRDNVHLINIKKDPIQEVTENGVRLASGEHIDLDALLLATGFDAVTGGFSRINIRGLEGRTLQDKWVDGSRTSLGMATSGFPNMFFLYGPQSPTAFAVGPVLCEIQADWIINTLLTMLKNKKTYIEAKSDAEARWCQLVNDEANKTLLPLNETSWYMAGNIPGKPKESLNFVAGLPAYQKALSDCTRAGWDIFRLG